MIADYHMHLRDADERIDHTVEAVERFVEAAAERRVDEIGFSEHVYYFRETRPLWTVPYHVERCRYDLDAYVHAVLQARERGLPVKLALEVDYVPGREEETRELLAPYPWDYLLGSVHFIDGFGIDGRPRLVDEVGVEETYRRYFDVLVLAARSGLFDALPHPDLVKVFGVRASDEETHYLHLETADAIEAAGVCIEVSAAGLHKPVGELYPERGLLEACQERAVPITLASDAHEPAHVGRDLDRAVALAREVGYETVTVFNRRERRQEPLG